METGPVPLAAAQARHQATNLCGKAVKGFGARGQDLVAHLAEQAVLSGELAIPIGVGKIRGKRAAARPPAVEAVASVDIATGRLFSAEPS
jgi:hypothetical protein